MLRRALLRGRSFVGVSPLLRKTVWVCVIQGIPYVAMSTPYATLNEVKGLTRIGHIFSETLQIYNTKITPKGMAGCYNI